MLSIYSNSLIQALHDYVTKTRAVAEAYDRQGKHFAVACETLPVIAVLEALWRTGDQAFVTVETLRHLYIMRGLALCDMVSILVLEKNYVSVDLGYCPLNTYLRSFSYS